MGEMYYYIVIITTITITTKLYENTNPYYLLLLLFCLQHMYVHVDYAGYSFAGQNLIFYRIFVIFCRTSCPRPPLLTQ